MDHRKNKTQRSSSSRKNSPRGKSHQWFDSSQNVTSNPSIHQSSHPCNEGTSWAPLITYHSSVFCMVIFLLLKFFLLSYRCSQNAAKTPSSSGTTPASQWRRLVVSHVGPIDHNIFGPLIFGKTHPLHHLKFSMPNPCVSTCVSTKKNTSKKLSQNNVHLMWSGSGDRRSWHYQRASWVNPPSWLDWSQVVACITDRYIRRWVSIFGVMK